MRSFFSPSTFSRRLPWLHAVVAMMLLVASAHACTDHARLSAVSSAGPVVIAAEEEHSACEGGDAASHECCLCICRTPGSTIVSVPLEEPLVYEWLNIAASQDQEAFFAKPLDRPPRFFL